MLSEAMPSAAVVSTSVFPASAEVFPVESVEAGVWDPQAASARTIAKVIRIAISFFIMHLLFVFPERFL